MADCCARPISPPRQPANDRAKYVIQDPWFYAAAVPAVLIAGISKGGFGGSIGLIAVPLMALVISPIQAAGIMLPILCLMDLFGVWAYRNRWDARNLRILLPAALLGIAVGTATFRYLDGDMIRLMLGVMALAFVGHRLLLRGDAGQGAGRPPSVVQGGFWGTVAGFTTFVAHAGGPPVSIYLLPQRLDRTVFVATTMVFYITVNYVKLVPYAWLGQLSAGNLATAAVLAPLVPLGMWLGLMLHRRVSDRVFYRVCYGLLAATGAKLLYDGLQGTLG